MRQWSQEKKMVKRKAVETCCVVDQFCNSPANLENPVPARGVCFSCGQPVCSKCSSIRKYHHYGKVRLCNDCQVEMDGGDRVVMRRLENMALRSGGR